MHLRRFKGKELPEVVAQVRAELGPDAVILHTKTRPRGMFRWLHGTGVEVVAAVDDTKPKAKPMKPPVHPLSRAAAQPTVTIPSVERPWGAWGTPGAPPLQSGVFGASAVEAPTSGGPDPHARSPQLHDLKAEIAELRRVLLRFGGARGLPSPMAPVYTWLVEAGVPETLAYCILDELPPAEAGGSIEAITAAVERRVAGMLRLAAAPATPTRGTIAFVGPTGAGKSTTLAKLAVRAHLEGCTPRVVSFDGMTPGTPAALDSIARLVGIRHEVATTPEALRAALDRPADLTLLDTPGLGRGDEAGIATLAALLHAARPTEIHAVIPATMKTEDALATLAALGALWISRIAFTKLDEAATFGSILAVAAESGLPLSYVTAGRDVPDDIHPATAPELARRILRRERP